MPHQSQGGTAGRLAAAGNEKNAGTVYGFGLFKQRELFRWKGGFLMRKAASSFAVFVFLVIVSVFPFNSASANVGGYFGVFGAYTLSPDASLRFYDYVYDSRYNYHYDYSYDLDVQETWAVGAKFGFTPPPLKFFSFEFEYFYLNPDVDRTEMTRAGTYYGAIEGDVKLHNFMFNAIVKYPEGRIHPYFGGGVGFSYYDVSVSVHSSGPWSSPYGSSYSVNDTVFAWQLLAGVEIDLSNNWSLDIGYRYFATEPGSDSDHDYYEYDYYDTHLDYKTSMVTVGLKYRF